MKKIVIGIILTLAIILGLIFVANNSQGLNDSEKFKKEYEKYNNIENSIYKNVTINKKNPIIYLNDENIIEEMSGGNKVIYLGTPTDNNCREVIELLLKVANEDGIEKVYYYNLNNKEENENKKINEEILKKINEDTKKDIKNIIIPTLILIKNKKVEKINMYSNKTINKNEKRDLEEIYDEFMIDLLMCTDKEKDC